MSREAMHAIRPIKNGMKVSLRSEFPLFPSSRPRIAEGDLHTIMTGGMEMNKSNCKNCDTKTTTKKSSASVKRGASDCSNCSKSK